MLMLILVVGVGVILLILLVVGVMVMLLILLVVGVVVIVGIILALVVFELLFGTLTGKDNVSHYLES